MAGMGMVCRRKIGDEEFWAGWIGTDPTAWMICIVQEFVIAEFGICGLGIAYDV